MTASVPCVQGPIPGMWPVTSVHITLARLAATKAVKAQMKAQGWKPQYVEASIANAYLEAHWDRLIAQAAEVIAKVPELRRMAEREARRRCAKLSSDAQRAKG